LSAPVIYGLAGFIGAGRRLLYPPPFLPAPPRGGGGGTTPRTPAGGPPRAFESPAVSSLLPGVVPRDQLPQATAWATSAGQTAQIVGPALGGLLYGVGAG